VKDADAADDDANADDAFPLARRPGVILARHIARIVVVVVFVVTDGRTGSGHRAKSASESADFVLDESALSLAYFSLLYVECIL